MRLALLAALSWADRRHSLSPSPAVLPSSTAIPSTSAASASGSRASIRPRAHRPARTRAVRPTAAGKKRHSDSPTRSAPAP